jgi:hypothetical protein
MHGIDHKDSGAHAPDVRWQVTTPTGVTFVCLVCPIDEGLDVRLTTSDELVCSTKVSSPDAATGLARRWLQVVLSNQSVRERISDHRIDAVH